MRSSAAPDDAAWMKRALRLARRAEGRTAPNPIVGCVIVDGQGRVVAEGWHRRAGEPHGEIDALARVGGRAPGCTAYVTLEPCNHQGRTGPCAPRLKEAGLARVVIGAMDPIPGHAGGAAWLRRRGVAVTTGVLAEACEEANRPFFTWARQRRPWFVLKAGATLDGRVATARGESRWITGEAARAEVHRLRDRLDAVLVGVGTVLADDPQLTVRGVRGGRDPRRVVLDSSLRTPPSAKVLPGAIIATTEAAADGRARRLEAAGAVVWRLPGPGGLVDLHALAARLGAEGVLSVLVEGGPSIHASFVAAGLADEVRLYLAPMLLGGHGRHAGPTWVTGDGALTLGAAPRMTFREVRRVGDDLLLVARPAPAP